MPINKIKIYKKFRSENEENWFSSLTITCTGCSNKNHYIVLKKKKY